MPNHPLNIYLCDYSLLMFSIFLIKFQTMKLLKLCLIPICFSQGIYAQKTLKETYKDAFKVGVAVNQSIVSGRDKTAQQIVEKQFNTITVENVMKAALINPKPNEFNYGPADEFVEFGKKNNMFIIGHTLVWHNQTPDWFFFDEQGKPKSKDAVKECLLVHIKTVGGGALCKKIRFSAFAPP